MTIYAIRNDGYHYQELDLEVNDFIDDFPETYDYGQCHDFSVNNIAMSDFWKLMRTGFRKLDNEENRIPDITTWIDATLLLSPKAHRLLGDALSPYGEFLPIMIDTGTDRETYQIFNCLTMAKVVEEKSSDTHIAFDPNDVADKLIFKTPFQRCLDLFCQLRLKDLVESFDLNGIMFDEHLGTFLD